MLRLAYKKITENRKMTLITMVGIAFSMVILVVSVYRIYASDVIEKEQFKHFAGENRIQYDKLLLFDDYTRIDDFGYIFDGNFAYTDDVLEALSSMKEVKGLRATYQLNERICTVSMGDIVFDAYDLFGIDPRYDTFDESLIELYDDKKVIIGGRDFLPDDTNVCLIGEISLLYLGLTPEEIVGKSVNIQGYTYPITIVGVFSNEFSDRYWVNDLEEVGKYIENVGVTHYTGDFVFSMDVVREIAPEDNIPNRVSLTLYDFNDMKKVCETIRKAYGVSGSSDYFDYYQRVLETTAYSRLLLFFGAVTLGICLLLLSVTIAINISDQRSTIQLLSILGEKKHKLVLMILEETLILAGIGTFLGLFLGYVITTSIAASYTDILLDVMNTRKLILPIKYLLLLGIVALGFSSMVGIGFGIYGVQAQKESRLYEE